MKNTISKIIIIVLLSTSICWRAQADEPKNPAMKPNIIFFLADDMGWGDSRAYNPNSKISMPNLDKLAAEGMRFNDAHTSTAVCAPSRYSAITGNYHWRGRYPWGNWKYTGGSQILKNQLTVADILRDNGYDTAFFGKLHLGGDFYKKNSDEFVKTWWNPEDKADFSRGLQNGPLSYGFNYSYVLLRGIQKSPFAFFENDQLVGNPDKLTLWKKGSYGNTQINFDGIGMPDWDSSKVGPVLTQKAVEFIDRHHRKNLADGTHTPFFLYYSSQSAHRPFTPPDSFHGTPVKGVTAMTPHTDMIYEIDVALGKLIDSLEQRGLRDNTLIIFTSDNGGKPSEKQFGHDAVGGLRGRKGQIWEGGHRVPLVVKWGDGTLEGSVIPPGTTSNQLIGIQDMMATLAELVGQNLPADQARDSISFLPVLLDHKSKAEPVRNHMIMETWKPMPYAVIAIRVGQWKLILDHNYEILGLYNLADDLAEMNNLMDDPGHAERVELMRNRLIEIKGTSGFDVIRGLGGHTDITKVILSMIRKTSVLIRIATFIIATIFITFFSWQSLHNPKSYGFYRFFAFEAILIIVLLNIPFWIKDPLSPIQTVSWLFVFFSLIFAIQGLYLLRKLSGSTPKEDQKETHAFKNTTNFVTNGIYKYIRHPIYSSLLLLAWGNYLKHISIFSTIAVLFASALLIATAKFEEGENLLSFGSAYTAYIKKTKMFIPYLF